MQMLTRLFLSLCVSLALSSAAWAQTLVVHKNANLSEQATTKSKAIDHLEPGDEVELVEDGKTNRFFHVETAGGVQGWIYDTLVHFEDESEEEAAATQRIVTIGAITSSSIFTSHWLR